MNPSAHYLHISKTVENLFIFYAWFPPDFTFWWCVAGVCIMTSSFSSSRDLSYCFPEANVRQTWKRYVSKQQRGSHSRPSNHWKQTKDAVLSEYIELFILSWKAVYIPQVQDLNIFVILVVTFLCLVTAYSFWISPCLKHFDFSVYKSIASMWLQYFLNTDLSVLVQ